MGTLYTVLTLDQECAEWLDREDIPHPPCQCSSRFPTPREIAEVLGQLPDCCVVIESDAQTREWSAEVEAANGFWTVVHIRDFGGEETPHEFYFSNGWPQLIFIITERLTHHCGSLIVVDDSGSQPMVVYSGADVAELLRQYEGQ